MITAFAEMLKRHAGQGRVAWIGLRPARREEILTVETADVTAAGLCGDHAKEGKRAVTLIQAEHLPVIAALAGLDRLQPEVLRRNFVISGINLAALRKAKLQIGSAVLQVTGPCPPCSRMEEVLGHGGYNAMRGHGGWYAEVVEPGRVALGASVTALTSAE
ncbi:MOSC domain-containing protein [Leisingera sp. HS039]|uniref:MOSC domain-containing protein n=1 Tax=unclassified Leisingera TaxID=2614906 RepID=UPI001070E6FE|nr:MULTISPECIES: MOSC domain-containing protein [unclassified Leisingera]MBQ4823084.1 MOSC domain-containing protein [Leisingera sp. HS039]QBR36314.1 MOSC domain-containing protein [Leisingera sp. NJS201]